MRASRKAAHTSTAQSGDRMSGRDEQLVQLVDQDMRSDGTTGAWDCGRFLGDPTFSTDSSRFISKILSAALAARFLTRAS